MDEQEVKTIIEIIYLDQLITFENSTEKGKSTGNKTYF